VRLRIWRDIRAAAHKADTQWDEAATNLREELSSLTGDAIDPDVGMLPW
jgi:hypothetical protein